VWTSWSIKLEFIYLKNYENNMMFELNLNACKLTRRHSCIALYIIYYVNVRI